MTVNASFAFVIAIMIGVGTSFIRRSGSDRRGNRSSRLVRWTGYGLVAVAILLVVFSIWLHFQWELHSRGH